MQSSDYLRTDTLEDALSSLELAVEFYDRGKSDERYWKWFVIAMHSGVQGCFSLALAGSHSLLVQKSGVAAKMLAAIEARSEIPAPHMDNFLRLYAKLQSESNLRSSEVLPLPKSIDQKSGLESLDELRDEFLHFNTKSWSCEYALIESAARTAVEVARFLLFESRAILIYDYDVSRRAEHAVASLSHRLKIDA